MLCMMFCLLSVLLTASAWLIVIFSAKHSAVVVLILGDVCCTYAIVPSSFLILMIVVIVRYIYVVRHRHVGGACAPALSHFSFFYDGYFIALSNASWKEYVVFFFWVFRCDYTGYALRC